MDLMLSEPTWTELKGIFNVFLALIGGAIIGWERESVGKEAGIRTFSLISAGACCFATISQTFSLDSGARIVANIIMGVGFITGGVIFQQEGLEDKSSAKKQTSHNFTTAAVLWITASIGLMLGLNLYLLAIAVIIFSLLLLRLPTSSMWKFFIKK